jgi:hypothetical protein
MMSPISESADKERTTSDAERMRLDDVRRKKERKEMSGIENSSFGGRICVRKEGKKAIFHWTVYLRIEIFLTERYL